jgi:hypothetical protein
VDTSPGRSLAESEMTRTGFPSGDNAGAEASADSLLDTELASPLAVEFRINAPTGNEMTDNAATAIAQRPIRFMMFSRKRVRRAGWTVRRPEQHPSRFVTTSPRLRQARPTLLQKASGRDGEHEWQRSDKNTKQYEAHCIPPCVNGRRLGWTGFVVGMLKSLRSFELLYMGKREVPEGIHVPRSMVALRQARQARKPSQPSPLFRRDAARGPLHSDWIRAAFAGMKVWRRLDSLTNLWPVTPEVAGSSPVTRASILKHLS